MPRCPSDRRICLILRGIGFFILILFFSFDGVYFQTTLSNAASTNVSFAPAGKISLPVFELPIPKNESEKNYLGVSGTKNFKITQINSPVLIIEVFSLYCPHCQRSAPFVNDFFQIIQRRTDLKEKIKIIGIGAMNSAYEVNVFKSKYKIPFPLFPDPDGDIARMLGVTGTPTFIGATINNKGAAERFYFRTVELSDASGFLSEILKLSPLKPEDTK